MTEIKSPWAKKDRLTEKTEKTKEPINKDSLDAHYRTWKQAQSPQTAGPMLEQLQPDIEASLKHYGGKNPDRLRTQAQLLTLQAAESYDPDKGTALSTHVRNSLHKLTRIRNDRSNVMHIPENVLGEQARLREIEDEFKAENDRTPNLSELADRSTYSIKQIQRIRNYNGTSTESASTSEKGDLLLSGEDKTAEKMWLDYVYFELDPIDKKVYEWSTGYGGTEKIPKAEIAKRLGISAPAISKRINKILGKIEEGQELNAR